MLVQGDDAPWQRMGDALVLFRRELQPLQLQPAFLSANWQMQASG